MAMNNTKSACRTELNKKYELKLITRMKAQLMVRGKSGNKQESN